MKKKILIFNIKKSSLNEEIYEKIVRKYSKSFKYPIQIKFDNRIKDCGRYIFNSEKKYHSIVISVASHRSTDSNEEKYNLLSTTLHEICHASQKERLGDGYDSDEFRYIKGDEDSVKPEDFTPCEIEARNFENKNVIEAVEFYNKWLNKLVAK